MIFRWLTSYTLQNGSIYIQALYLIADGIVNPQKIIVLWSILNNLLWTPPERSLDGWHGWFRNGDAGGQIQLALSLEGVWKKCGP